MARSARTPPIWIGRTRWRFKVGRYRRGFRREQGRGSFALPFLLGWWITRSPAAALEAGREGVPKGAGAERQEPAP